MSQLRLQFAHRRSKPRSQAIALLVISVRLAGALLALAVATAHVADQGGLMTFTGPDWLGWTYRLVEVGGVITALTLLVPRSAELGWIAGLLLAVESSLGYLVSRTIGVPGDSGDVGNWADWVGSLFLVIEAGLVAISIGMLTARESRTPVVVEATVTPDLNRSGVTRSPISR